MKLRRLRQRFVVGRPSCGPLVLRLATHGGVWFAGTERVDGKNSPIVLVSSRGLARWIACAKAGSGSMLRRISALTGDGPYGSHV